MSSELTRGLPEIAQHLALDYRASLSQLFVQSDPPWRGFQPGGLYLRHVMRGQWNGLNVCVFDFEPKGDSESETRLDDLRTAVCVADDSIDWPETTIRPYGHVDRIGSWFFKEVPLCPESYRRPRFIVDGDCMEWPRLIDPRLDDWLRRHDDVVIRVGPGRIAIYREGKPLEADQVVLYLEAARDLVEVIRQPAADGDRSGSAGAYLVRSQRRQLGWLAGAALLMCVLSFCGLHLWQAWRQSNAHELASTRGWIHRVAKNDGEIDLQFSYVVDGDVFYGSSANQTFVWRPIQLDDVPAKADEWREGDRLKVFYDPNAPHIGVLDNSFTRGDANFVKILLAVVATCIGLLIGPLLVACVGRWLGHRTEPVSEPGQTRFPLSRAPYTLDLLALSAVPSILLGINWILLLALGDLPWLVTAFAWIRWATVINVAAVPAAYLLERWWRGPDGDSLMVDHQRQRLVLGQGGGRPGLDIELDRVQSRPVARNDPRCRFPVRDARIRPYALLPG